MSTIGLIACSKSKRTTPAQARDLYDKSATFCYGRSYLIRRSHQWFILSARHCLVHPDQVLDPYEETLVTASKEKRLQWSRTVIRQLTKVIKPRDHVILLAGERYTEFLLQWLCDICTVEQPLKHLSMGHALKWLKQQSDQNVGFFKRG